MLEKAHIEEEEEEGARYRESIRLHSVDAMPIYTVKSYIFLSFL